MHCTVQCSYMYKDLFIYLIDTPVYISLIWWRQAPLCKETVHYQVETQDPLSTNTCQRWGSENDVCIVHRWWCDVPCFFCRVDILTKICTSNKNRLKEYHPAAFINGHWLWWAISNTLFPSNLFLHRKEWLSVHL